jgi:hypothetical protein
MKLYLILGIFVLVLFSLVIAGMVAYRPLLEQLGRSEKDSDVVEIRENFNDGNIDSRLAFDQNGNCKWKFKSGVMTMDLGTSPRDAGIIYLADPVDRDKPFLWKIRVRAYNPTGNLFTNWPVTFIQSDEPPATIMGAEALKTVVLQALQFDGRSGNRGIRLGYRSPSSNFAHNEVSWDGENDVWSNRRHNYGHKGVIGNYYTFELHSDGKEFYYVLRDSAEKVLEKTEPVPWRRKILLAVRGAYVHGFTLQRHGRGLHIRQLHEGRKAEEK